MVDYDRNKLFDDIFPLVKRAFPKETDTHIAILTNEVISLAETYMQNQNRIIKELND